jgi:hypothetical protein
MEGFVLQQMGSYLRHISESYRTMQKVHGGMDKYPICWAVKILARGYE